MIAQNFEYVVPASLGEAVNLLQKHAGRAKILAGGHSLIPMMKLRLAAPEFLVDIGRIPELSYVKEDGNKIRIGALTTHYMVETSDAIRRRISALADAAGLIGDVQVRNKGTIGGSVAHAFWRHRRNGPSGRRKRADSRLTPPRHRSASHCHEVQVSGVNWLCRTLSVRLDESRTRLPVTNQPGAANERCTATKSSRTMQSPSRKMQ